MGERKAVRAEKREDTGDTSMKRREEDGMTR